MPRLIESSINFPPYVSISTSLKSVVTSWSVTAWPLTAWSVTAGYKHLDITRGNNGLLLQ